MPLPGSPPAVRPSSTSSSKPWPRAGSRSVYLRIVATELAAQPCFGAAKMVLDTGAHPALLKDDVTTPAGCTMDGILTLEEGGLRVTLIKAVVEATRRSGELGT